MSEIHPTPADMHAAASSRLTGVLLPDVTEAHYLPSLELALAGSGRLLLPEHSRTEVRGRGLEALGEPSVFIQAGRRLRGWQLPVTRSERPLEGVIVGPVGSKTFTIAYPGQRPDGVKQPGGSLQDFILAALAILEEARRIGDQTSLAGLEGRILSARRLAIMLLGDRGSSEAPPMSLIVRHVELDRLPEVAGPLARHPRRILQRIRTQTPLARVAELDPACLRALVRAPGRTVAEKAGARQSILGVARTDSIDTLENRVLRDFLKRSAAEAARYARVHARFERSRRWRQVQAWGRAARHEAEVLSDAGVKALAAAVTPNYVLTNDARYRRIWAGYQELLKREQAEDEAWLWQRRLWADLVRLFALAALVWSPRLRDLALSPIGITSEQHRGRWTVPVGHLGAFVLRPKSGHSLVVQLHDVEADDAASGLARRLGASFWLSIETADGVKLGSVAGWAAHAARSDQPELDADVAAAEAALAATGVPQLRGMVLRSLPGRLGPAEERRGARSTAISVPLDPQGLPQALELMSDRLLDLIAEIAP